MRLLVFITALFAAAPAVAEIVDFMLPDLEGKPVSLSDFRGKWVIVNYWATSARPVWTKYPSWCPCTKTTATSW